MKKILSRLINPETIRYLIFGALTTAVDAAVFWLLTRVFGVHYLAANVPAWVAAVLFAFVTNKLIVFKSESLAPRVWLRELSLFVLSRLFSLGLATLWLFVTVEAFGMNEDISKLISYVFVVILNYITGKLLVFRKTRSSVKGDGSEIGRESNDSSGRD